MNVLANAKLNLDLKILGNCGDYHMLQSSVTTVDVYDSIEVTARADNHVVVRGTDSIEQSQNIAYRAGALMVERCNTSGVDISITKGIPLSSGMGGSSADGAGVLVAMCHMFGIDTLDSRVQGIACQIGSDVSYLMLGGCAVITGKGDDIELLPYRERHFVVTTFDTRLDTGSVFALYDTLSRVDCANALQGAVEQQYDYMVLYKADIATLGYSCSMTGSGSAYFVQCNYPDEAMALSSRLNALGHSSMACSSCTSGVVIVDN